MGATRLLHRHRGLHPGLAVPRDVTQDIVGPGLEGGLQRLGLPRLDAVHTLLGLLDHEVVLHGAVVLDAEGHRPGWDLARELDRPLVLRHSHSPTGPPTLLASTAALLSPAAARGGEPRS